jgi:hypothetical protein
MARQELWQVYITSDKSGKAVFTAYPVGEEPSDKCWWKVQKPVRASSARGAVRKVNTRTKQRESPRPFVNPKKI